MHRFLYLYICINTYIYICIHYTLSIGKARPNLHLVLQEPTFFSPKLGWQVKSTSVGSELTRLAVFSDAVFFLGVVLGLAKTGII